MVDLDGQVGAGVTGSTGQGPHMTPPLLRNNALVLGYLVHQPRLIGDLVGPRIIVVVAAPRRGFNEWVDGKVAVELDDGGRLHPSR